MPPHATTQPVAAKADLDLRRRYARVGRVDFDVDARKLLVERPEESVRRFALPPDQDHFIGEVANASLELARFGQQRVTLLADAIELVALVTEAGFRVSLARCDARVCAREKREQREPPH